MTPDSPQSESDPMSVENDPVGMASDHAQVAPRGKRRWLRILIALLVAAPLIAVAQSMARQTDHQIANIVTAVVTAIAGAYALWQLECIAAGRGKAWLVPLCCLVLLVSFPFLFRFDGFSGELIPQFKFRFASNLPQKRSLDAGTDGAVRDVDPGNGDTADATAIASADSLGFLGSSRTGVIPRREFSIPAEVSEVKPLWNIGVGEGWSSFAVVSDRAVTLEQREERECLNCYRLVDGELLWTVSHEAMHQNPLGGTGPRSTPTIAGDHVYAQGATGKVWCVDWRSGKVEWTVDLLELAGWDQVASELAIRWGRAGSPLWVDGICVVPFGAPETAEDTGRSLIALDAKTGEIRWTAGADQISYASPGLMQLVGQRQIVSVNETSITGHRIEDGEVLWAFEWFGQSNGGANCAMAVPAGADRFLIGKGYGGGSALVQIEASANGTLNASAVWESNRVLKTKFTHACVDRQTAYAISNGSLEAVSISDGEQRWVQPRGERLGQGQLLLVEDTLVGQAESGEVVLVAADPDEYRVLLRLSAMSSKTWNIPTVAGRHLLVRNDRQAFCFLLPPRS